MMTRVTWDMIRRELSAEIDKGTWQPGDRLPTEPQLMQRFGAGRHSLRRAIEALAKDGMLSIEQGRGTFVEATPKLTYSIGKRTRLQRSLLPQGVTVTRQFLGAAEIAASPRVAIELGMDEGALVLESRRMTLANDTPIAVGVAYHSLDRFPNYRERRDAHGSTTETYASYGIRDYVRAKTEFYSRPARVDETKELKQHPQLPVTIVRSVDALTDGTPISYSKVVWASGRVKFTMSGDESDGP